MPVATQRLLAAAWFLFRAPRRRMGAPRAHAYDFLAPHASSSLSRLSSLLPSAVDSPRFLINWAALASVVGPVFLTFTLTRWSGKALLEKGLHKTRPDYAAYVQRTSGFIPWPPKAL